MFNILYVIWFLLPLALFLFALWAVLKPYLQIAGRENGLDYLKQGIFCLICFGIAVVIDQTESFNQLILDYSSEGWFDLSVARWLLFPAVLVLISCVHHYFWARKQEPKKEAKIRRY